MGDAGDTPRPIISLSTTSGICPECGSAYKWMETRTETINGITVKTRTFVCRLNHLTTEPREWPS